MICSLDCEINPKCTTCKVKNIHSRGITPEFKEQLALYKAIESSADVFLENIDKHIPRID